MFTFPEWFPIIVLKYMTFSFVHRTALSSLEKRVLHISMQRSLSDVQQIRIEFSQRKSSSITMRQRPLPPVYDLFDLPELLGFRSVTPSHLLYYRYCVVNLIVRTDRHVFCKGNICKYLHAIESIIENSS